MPVIPKFEASVRPDAMPGVRVQAAGSGLSPVGDAMADAAVGVGRAVAGVALDRRDKAERQQKEADTAAAQMAYAAAQEAAVKFEAETLPAKYSGLNAAGATKALDDFLLDTVDATARDLSPEARKKFNLFFPQLRTSLTGTVLRHVETETRRAKNQAAEALVSSAIPAAVQAHNGEAEEVALAPALAALADRHKAAGLAPEVTAEEGRKLRAMVATGKLELMQSALAAAPTLDNAEAIASGMHDEIMARESAGHISADAASRWRARVEVSAKARRDGFEQEEAEAQRTRVAQWETDLLKLEDAGDPRADEWLAAADDAVAGNPRYALHIRQVVHGMRIDRARASADKARRLSKQHQDMVEDAEEEARTRLAVIEARVKGGRLTARQGMAYLDRMKTEPGTLWTRSVLRTWEETATAIGAPRPAPESHKLVWQAFDDAADSNAFGDRVIDGNGQDITGRALRRAREEAMGEDEGQDRETAVAEFEKSYVARTLLASKARRFTIDWLKVHEDKPVDPRQYTADLQDFLHTELAAKADRDARAAVEGLK